MIFSILAGFAARRALRPGALAPMDKQPIAIEATLLTCLALTYLTHMSTWTRCLEDEAAIYAAR